MTTTRLSIDRLLTEEESRKTTTSLRLIFWGVLVVFIDIKVNNFDLLNNFIGMLMISSGGIGLSRIDISPWYNRGMSWIVVVMILETIDSFYSAVLVPLSPGLAPPPYAFFIVLAGVIGFIAFITLLGFCRCMKEFCETLKWTKPSASWQFTFQLILFGVFIPGMILSVPLALFISSLDFQPVRKNTVIVHEKTGDGMANEYRNGVFIRSYPSDTDSQQFKGAAPEPEGLTFHFNHHEALVSPFAAIITGIFLIPFAVMAFWSAIHFLVSVSRMIRSTEQALATQIDPIGSG